MITLERVFLEKKNITDYSPFITARELDFLKRTAKRLAGKKIVHINATAQGGGVAEMLSSLVPLLRSLAIDAEWLTICVPAGFFKITKKIHNALQGKNYTLTKNQWGSYFYVNQKLAKVLNSLNFDLAVVHDPQPLGLIDYYRLKKPIILRIHIDLSTPSKEVLSVLLPHMKTYDRTIFSLKEFGPAGLPPERLEFIEPAIDPLAVKNKRLSLKTAGKILSQFGIKPNQPLITQVSRFDPWKDPLGVIELYRLVRKEVSGLQLMLLGIFRASDDPEAIQVFRRAKRFARDDLNIHLISEIPSSGRARKTAISNDLLVNAAQTASDVILQKSTREGFGLVVAEAMWKRKAVVGGNALGIRHQISDGKNGFIAKGVEEGARLVVRLLKDKKLRNQIGLKARESVRKKFLITRLLKDHLRVYREVLGV
jgi:trehalose synthase